MYSGQRPGTCLRPKSPGSSTKPSLGLNRGTRLPALTSSLIFAGTFHSRHANCRNCRRQAEGEPRGTLMTKVLVGRARSLGIPDFEVWIQAVETPNSFHNMTDQRLTVTKAW